MLLALLILAWATQLLVSQWTRGAQAGQGGEDCDPRSCRQPAVTVRLHPVLTATTPDVRLGEVCEMLWSSPAPPAADGGNIAEIIIAHQPQPGARLIVRLEEVLVALRSAGVHEHGILVEGPIRCEVTVSGALPGASAQDAVLMAWAGDSADEPEPREQPPQVVELAPSRQPRSGSASGTAPRAAEFVGVHGSLGELLRRDLARQLRLPLESLHLRFAPESAGLAERMDIPAQRIRLVSKPDLGEATWLLELSGREIHLRADVSATITRTLAARRIAAGQVIAEPDIHIQQASISRLAERGLTRAEALGREAARDIPPAAVLKPEDLAQRLLVRRGEYVSVQMQRSGVEMRALARALEDGVLGQVIRARSETTGQIIEVCLTAPQAGKAVEAHDASASSAGETVDPR